jgi:hypothetical protein
MKTSYADARRKGTTYIQKKEGRLTGLVTSCVGTAFCITLWEEREKEGST